MQPKIKNLGLIKFFVSKFFKILFLILKLKFNRLKFLTFLKFHFVFPKYFKNSIFSH